MSVERPFLCIWCRKWVPSRFDHKPACEARGDLEEWEYRRGEDARERERDAS